MTTIYWTAKNNSSYLNGYRQAASMLAAVRDARYYLRNELYGEGVIYYFDSDPSQDDGMYDSEPCRTDERSIFTGFRWKTHQ